MGPVYGTHPMGGEGGVAGPGAYIYTHIRVIIFVSVCVEIAGSHGFPPRGVNPVANEGLHNYDCPTCTPPGPARMSPEVICAASGWACLSWMTVIQKTKNHSF